MYNIMTTTSWIILGINIVVWADVIRQLWAMRAESKKSRKVQ